MTAIATYVVVVVFPLMVVYLVFQALVRGVPEGQAHEIEVKLFPPSIRRRISADRRTPSDTVPLDDCQRQQAKDSESDDKENHIRTLNTMARASRTSTIVPVEVGRNGTDNQIKR